MSQDIACSKCGYSNRQGARFCGNCATPLTQSANDAPYFYLGPRDNKVGTGQPEKPSWWGSTKEEPPRDSTAIDRTHTGIFLLLISLVLGPIPYIMYIGFVLGFIGAILVILGRKAFGQFHSNLVKISVGIWILGIIISAVVGAAYGYDVANSTASGTDPTSIAQRLNNAFNTLIIGVLVGAAVLGLSQVLITYALQTQTGRILLFAGYASGLAIAIFVASIITPQINAAISQVITTQDLTPLNNLRDQSTLLGILGIIPASISALAFYLAVRRIGRGEIPDPATMPAWS